MDVKLEQRANIKFCVKLGKSGVETFEMIRAYEDEAIIHARCFEWHARLREAEHHLKTMRGQGDLPRA
jgi:hypothetical protein